MKQASVRDLRYSFKDVEALLASGEEIEIIKRKKVIARLVPVEPPKSPRVDFRAQLQQLWSDNPPDLNLIDIISEGRGEY